MRVKGRAGRRNRETSMMRLILTTTDTGAGALRGTGIADVVIGFDFRFVWGPLPLQAELASFLEGRSAEHDSVGTHWLDSLNRRQLGEIGDEYPGSRRVLATGSKRSSYGSILGQTIS